VVAVAGAPVQVSPLFHSAGKREKREEKRKKKKEAATLSSDICNCQKGRLAPPIRGVKEEKKGRTSRINPDHLKARLYYRSA